MAVDTNWLVETFAILYIQVRGPRRVIESSKASSVFPALMGIMNKSNINISLVAGLEENEMRSKVSPVNLAKL
jgi:hypothetical protein